MWQEKLKIVKTNPIARLYPFSKLWIAILYSVSSMLLGSIKVDGYPVYMMISFLIVPLLALLSGIWKKFFNIFTKILILCLFIVVLQSFLVRTDTVLWVINVFNLFKLNVYDGSVQYALMLSFTIMCMGGILVWFFSTTENKELIRACEKKGMGPKTAYVFLSTLQMIEIMQKNSKVIMNAQQARGVETEGNLFVRSKAFIPSMIPLVLSSVANTEERVLTLESKGFSVKGKKTHLFDIEPSGKEKLAVTIAIIYAVLAICWRVLTWIKL